MARKNTVACDREGCSVEAEVSGGLPKGWLRLRSNPAPGAPRIENEFCSLGCLKLSVVEMKEPVVPETPKEEPNGEAGQEEAVHGAVGTSG